MPLGVPWLIGGKKKELQSTDRPAGFAAAPNTDSLVAFCKTRQAESTSWRKMLTPQTPLPVPPYRGVTHYTDLWWIGWWNDKTSTVRLSFFDVDIFLVVRCVCNYQMTTCTSQIKALNSGRSVMSQDGTQARGPVVLQEIK